MPHLGVVMQLRGIGNAAMVEILKFVQQETAFDPESIQVLASALDDAWSRIEQSGTARVLAGLREVWGTAC
jgi:hypothetical protein